VETYGASIGLVSAGTVSVPEKIYGTKRGEGKEELEGLIGVKFGCVINGLYAFNIN